MTRAHADTGPNLRANGERADAFLSPRVLAREAAKLVAELDLRLSPARIRQLVTIFVQQGRSDVELRSFLLSYADPTGETAVRNVERARR